MKRRNRHPKRPRTLRQMIIRMPASVDFEEILATPDVVQLDVDNPVPDLPKDLRGAMVQSGGIVIGSEPNLSKVIWLVLALVNKGELTAIFSNHSKQWTVIAAEHLAMNQTQILKFMSDINTYDEDGNVTGTEPVTNVKGKLQTFSGHSWKYV